MARNFDYGSEQYWPADEKTAETAGQQLKAVIAQVAGQHPPVTPGRHRRRRR